MKRADIAEAALRHVRQFNDYPMDQMVRQDQMDDEDNEGEDEERSK